MPRYIIHTEGTILAEPKVFYEVALKNPDFQWERDNKGNIIFMTPTYSGTGKFNEEMLLQLGIWNKKQKNGIVFDSSTGFSLPDGSIVSPDASWIRKDRWLAIPKKEREESFAPIAPDFVIELKSKNNLLKDLHDKMSNYIQNGVKLGWLIDLDEEKIYIYEPPQLTFVRTINSFSGKLSGTPVLPDFELDLDEIKKMKEEEK